MIPVKNFNIPTPMFIHCPKVFSPEEMEQISFLEELQVFEKGTIGNNQNMPNIRSSDIAWLAPDHNSNWVYDKFCNLTSQVNRDFFLLDLDHLERFQYTVYKPDQHYSWHLDFEPTYTKFSRKISGVIMVSNPEVDFEGGEFEIVVDGNVEKPRVLNLGQGDVVFFASWMPHRVRPVTSGKRKTLVGWVRGKNNG